MKDITALKLRLGAALATLIVDEAINSVYESAIVFFAKHPRLSNNPVGGFVEDILIELCFDRNMPIVSGYMPHFKQPPIEKVTDEDPAKKDLDQRLSYYQ